MTSSALVYGFRLLELCFVKSQESGSQGMIVSVLFEVSRVDHLSLFELSRNDRLSLFHNLAEDCLSLFEIPQEMIA